jgi:hypothetical protein
MTAAFTHPGVREPKRDRWGRPLVVPPNGGEPIAYTRISTLAKAIDDTTNLTKWKCRQVALGIGQRPDLAQLASVLDPINDKGKLNALCDDALNAASSGKAANVGTVLHSYTEWVDTDPQAIDRIPIEHQRAINNYLRARNDAGLTPLAMERFVVNDELQAAGSFDRLWHHPVHGVIVGDLKTGSSAADFPHATAMQVATYARSMLYDLDTDTRTAIPGVNLQVGALIHLDQTTGECNIYGLDIAAGWEAAQLAVAVNKWRKVKGLAVKW